MPSPSGIFVGLSQAELDALRVTALAATTGGQRTSLSGGQKSGSKEYQMSPKDVLMEIIYAERKSGARSPRVDRTVMNTAYPAYPTVAGENVS